MARARVAAGHLPFLPRGGEVSAASSVESGGRSMVAAASLPLLRLRCSSSASLPALPIHSSPSLLSQAVPPSPTQDHGSGTGQQDDLWQPGHRLWANADAPQAHGCHDFLVLAGGLSPPSSHHRGTHHLLPHHLRAQGRGTGRAGQTRLRRHGGGGQWC